MIRRGPGFFVVVIGLVLALAPAVVPALAADGDDASTAREENASAASDSSEVPDAAGPDAAESDTAEPAAAEPDAADPEAPGAPPLPAPAAKRRPSDHALLGKLLRESGADTRDPAPFRQYATMVRDAVLSSLGISIGKLGALAPALWIVPYLLVALVIVAAALLIYHGVRSRSPSLPRMFSQAVPLDDAPSHDLRAEAERLLARGALREALAALWHWLAVELAAKGLGRTGPEVTRREFVGSVGRMRPGWDRLPELTDLARTADVLAYGSTQVTAARVRALLPAAERLLQHAGSRQ